MTADRAIGAYLAAGDLRALFVEELGWDLPEVQELRVQLDGREAVVTPVAQKAGLHVFSVRAEDGEPLLAAEQLRVDRLVARVRAPERLLVFMAPDGQEWRWPERRKSGSIRLVSHSIRAGSRNPSLEQRLGGIAFALDEEIGLTLVDVRRRVRANFNAEEVTNRFYQRFEEQHRALFDGIEGLGEDADRRWYASLLLNRLMFIYFFQKKRFLNGDPDYLRTCLHGVQELRGPDQFYAFYREILIPMFHSGFGCDSVPAFPPDIAAIIGDVPYVNGGLFDEHPLESAHHIDVPDAEFEAIFDFFDAFTWHLDDRAVGDANEINPDILGHIFERYINLTSTGQRDNGAYYTKDDVSGYMAQATVAARVLEIALEATGVPLQHALAEIEPTDVAPDLFHGFDALDDEWKPLPDRVSQVGDDIARWLELDELGVGGFDHLLLPAEGWVECIDRRRRADRLAAAWSSGEIGTISALLGANVDLALVVDTVISVTATAEGAHTLWESLTRMRVLDPTCGSGAFLFAALDLLEDAYSALLRAARELQVQSPTSGRLEELLSEVARHPNERYFIRKHVALHNLYGVDIMPEAVEVAKLRLFLALAATLDKASEIEPLPDMDFNLRVGNVLVGVLDREDLEGRLALSSLLGLAEVPALLQAVDEAEAARSDMVHLQELGSSHDELLEAKSRVKCAEQAFVDRADAVLAEADGVAGSDLDEWRTRTKPLHWLVEFPDAIAAGGFDVVIGNPPYVGVPNSEVLYRYSGFRTDLADDLFMPCLERSADLVRREGRLAMIVMLKLTFSGKDPAKALRGLLAARFGTVLVSTFGRIPDGLFTGANEDVRVRNTIFIGGPGVGYALKMHRSTRLHIWTKDARETLFRTLSYSPNVILGEAPWPKLDRPGHVALLGALAAARLPYRYARKGDGVPLYHRKVSQYWVPVSPEPFWKYTLAGERFENTNVHCLWLTSERDRDIAFLAAAGAIGYFYWSALGDDFNVTKKTVQAIVEPALAVGDVLPDHFFELAATIREDLWKHRMYTLNGGMWVGNYEMHALRPLTLETDKLLLEALGVPDVQRDLEVWYRQVMRSSGRARRAVYGREPDFK